MAAIKCISLYQMQSLIHYAWDGSHTKTWWTCIHPWFSWNYGWTSRDWQGNRLACDVARHRGGASYKFYAIGWWEALTTLLKPNRVNCMTFLWPCNWKLSTEHGKNWYWRGAERCKCKYYYAFEKCKKMQVHALPYKPREVVSDYLLILLFLRSLKLDRSGASSNLFLKFNLFVYSKALRSLNIYFSIFPWL